MGEAKNNNNKKHKKQQQKTTTEQQQTTNPLFLFILFGLTSRSRTTPVLGGITLYEICRVTSLARLRLFTLDSRISVHQSSPHPPLNRLSLSRYFAVTLLPES